jgi:hypothetical protein
MPFFGSPTTSEMIRSETWQPGRKIWHSGGTICMRRLTGNGSNIQSGRPSWEWFSNLTFLCHNWLR